MSNNTYTAKETSFWKFIQENEIEIPIIQRDYAQGRLGKESLRKNFLSDLKKALDNEKPYQDKAMKMDFVYGSVEHDKINPLDGQQRLTTLWLLHWYIALRAGKLDEKIAGSLNRFSYETRITSREFCGNLCDSDHFKDFDGNDIVDFITRQTWFYSTWKQDPTIQSMLRMLGGTKVTDKKGENIVDGIEELFACPQKCEIKEGEKCFVYRKFNEYWCKLTGDNCPIVFYHLPLRDFGLSDDLYIKMNARGKQLTSLENFKADLVDYITEQSDSELLDEDAKRRWKALLEEREGIPIKMDTTWTDIFWRNKSVDSKIDEIYFAFLNRFFWDKLFMYKNKESKYVLDIGKGDETSTQENNNPSYKYLNNSNASQNVYDTTISYKELDMYKFYGGEIPYDVFKDLQIVLNRYKEIPACTWDDNFRFIPAYENDNNGNNVEITDTSGEKILKVTYLNQVQRIVFHAVCKYFIEGEADETTIKQWMRVVWNLVSGEDAKGPQIRSTSAMRSAMEFIDKLNSHNVYSCLAQYTEKLSDSEFDRRCKEEIAKAKQILDENGEIRKYAGIHKRKDGSDCVYWEDIIKDAEKDAFVLFKGTIRFLFLDENGNINWDDFDKKMINAKKYFCKKGVRDEYKEKMILLRSFIANFSKWSEFWDINYDNEVYTWKNLLISRCKPAHIILTNLVNANDDFISFKASLNEFDQGYEDIQNTVQEELVKTHILVEASKWHSKLNWRYNTYCLYPSNARADWKRYVIGSHRNQILSDLCDKKVIIDSENRRFKSGESNNFFWGWDINFKYIQDNITYDFQWNADGKIYLMENNERKTKADGTNYYFPTKGINDSESIERELEKLVNEDLRF